MIEEPRQGETRKALKKKFWQIFGHPGLYATGDVHVASRRLIGGRWDVPARRIQSDAIEPFFRYKVKICCSPMMYHAPATCAHYVILFVLRIVAMFTDAVGHDWTKCDRAFTEARGLKRPDSELKTVLILDPFRVKTLIRSSSESFSPDSFRLVQSISDLAL